MLHVSFYLVCIIITVTRHHYDRDSYLDRDCYLCRYRFSLPLYLSLSVSLSSSLNLFDCFFLYRNIVFWKSEFGNVRVAVSIARFTALA